MAQALTSVIERSEATTMMGLEKELKEAAQSLERRVIDLADLRCCQDACMLEHRDGVARQLCMWRLVHGTREGASIPGRCT